MVGGVPRDVMHLLQILMSGSSLSGEVCFAVEAVHGWKISRGVFVPWTGLGSDSRDSLGGDCCLTWTVASG